MPDFDAQESPQPTATSPEEIVDVTLPPSVRRLVDEYNAKIGLRDEFVWKWIYSLFPSFTLNTVPQEHFETARTEKTLLTMFVTIIDDIAETTDDNPTFLEARKVAHPTATPNFNHGTVDTEALRMLERIWTTLHEDLTLAPNYSTYRQLFRFDLNQTLNSIDYSQLLTNHLEIANMEESWAYGPHNMVMYAYADIDLMYSDIPETELSDLRRFLMNAQKMARIGNWVSTWEREIQDGDFSAGIVVKALEDGVITEDELQSRPPEELIESINEAKLEEYFLEEWEQFDARLAAEEYDTTALDLEGLREGMETVLNFHLKSRGYK